MFKALGEKEKKKKLTRRAERTWEPTRSLIPNLEVFDEIPEQTFQIRDQVNLEREYSEFSLSFCLRCSRGDLFSCPKALRHKKPRSN